MGDAKDLSVEESVNKVTALISDMTRTMKPYEALRFARALKSRVEKQSDSFSAAIIASVNGVAGDYGNFTVTDVSGRASVNTQLLHDQFPEAYDASVTWGLPYKTVRFTSVSDKKNGKNADDR